MEEKIYGNAVKIKLWKKILSVFLALIIGFGTIVTLIVGSSKLQDWLGIKSMLSAYAAEIVDTDDAVAVDEEAMLADHHTINLENRDGSNTVYLFSEPISYTDENGNLKTKDISVEKQTDKELIEEGYDYTNGQNDYRINFSSDSKKGLNVQFDKCTYSIIPESNISVSGSKETAVFLNEEFEVFEYENIYGSGTTLRFYPQLNGVKEEIVLDSNIGQNSFSFIIKAENCTAVLNDDGTVSLISNNDDTAMQTFSAPFAYDSEYVEGDYDEHYIDCDYELKDNSNGEYKLTVTVDENWLNNDSTVYPVVIDPTTSNITLSADASIYQNKGTNNYGKEQTCCFGYTTEYGIGRAYTKFTVPSAIKKGAVINSAYQWLRETTGRTNTTYVKPFMVTSSWSETGIYWSNRPSHNLSVVGTRRNINSTSTDDSRNHYWYKFDLKNAVKKWVDGSPNYGVTYISEEEHRKSYEWRAFASRTYSNSAMRPYTVINYTNDSTAPTVTSVTGNATNWTKNDVTLTVNGATDNSGGAGLHSTPYSFSTTKGNYVWQSSKTKTFSSNCTVYVYVRDAIGNIRLVSTQTINKIDKTAPSVPDITGVPSEWTNSSVTITANSSDSGSGVSQYSFSTSEGVYSWQTQNNKAYSENTTVYIYVKDNVGNISEAQTVVIDNIDNTVPSVPILTGEYDQWSNEDVKITAESTDDLSGINEYSFSTKPDVYHWQTENTAVFSESSKVYVYSKDNAGNISSQAEIDLKIDKILPSGSINVDLPTDWVKSVEISANASDEISGLHATPYSFSTSKNEYEWQESNKTTISHNGTIYVYARDVAENIVLLDTVVIDKIDDQSPIIEDVVINNVEDKTIVTVIANDTKSGIKEYSFDNGKTWQTGNVSEFEKDSLNYFTVQVRDKVYNVASKRCDIYTPQIFYENGKVGIYNPNPKCESDIYYKIDQGPLSWQKYDEPILLPENQKYIYVAFATNKFQLMVAKIDKIELKNQNDFSYSEQNTDLSLKYNGVSFNIDRQYKNNGWHYSWDSSLIVIDNGAIQVDFPNFSSLMYIYQNKYLYKSYNSDSSISVIYNENDTSIIEYVVNKDNVNYHYDLSGKLTKISNRYGDLFYFMRSDNKIIIKDFAQRETILNYSNDHLVSIIDNKGGIINYNYDDSNNLIKVTDQANVIIGYYNYDDNNVLISSGNKNIIRDNQNRVSEIVLSNGYYTRYTYNNNEIVISTPDEKVISYKFDNLGNIISSVDEYGKEITYNYDSDNSVFQILEGEEVLEEYRYNENNKLTYKFDSSGSITYYYDDMENIVKTYETFNDDSSKNKTTFYVYDENKNVKIQAVMFDKLGLGTPNDYSPEINYDQLLELEYHNGIVTKKTDVNNDITVFYDYDNYGNNIKTTTKTVENDKVSLSINESVYDNLNRILSSKNEESEITYTYDAAGRTLLVNTDGSYQRTVYDNYGRVVQEISNSDYNPELDNLPNSYSNTDIGQRYVYDEVGNLVKEINNYNIETTYEYSDVGTLSKKHFDIYDYYYLPNGNCDKINVNGQTIVDYDYKVTDSEEDVSEGQFINRISYANGCVEEEKVDKYSNVYGRYVDGDTYFFVYKPYNDNKYYNYEDESFRRNTVYVYDNSYTFVGQTFYKQPLFRYTVTTDGDIQTVREEHFDAKVYEKVINENTTTFKTPLSSFDYTIDSVDDTATVSIVNGENTLLSSTVNYNEDDNILSKSYGEEKLSFEIQYDDNGNIAADKNNQYQYDNLGQLKATTGNINSSYTYDDRGNMLSKTVNGVTSNFAYTNTQWQDQLTSVNGNDLSYDANGNLVSYDGKTYTWSHGKWLESITDGDNTFSYTYDSNGIRSDKTVNGVKTSYNTLNGKILSQFDATNEIYFQYSNDAPVGFVLNDTQYFYITNLSGDIVGITDSNGELIAEYSYDEWGKLLGITTAQENNAEQLAVAEINPFRYRGYYYDNETGMYYLQSRYYDPELCRFISADDFAYINTDTPMSVNAYAYCINNPLNFVDPNGNAYISGTPQGDAIGKIISTILITWDASLLSEDFSYYIGGILINHSDLLFSKTGYWYDKSRTNFTEFMNTSLYSEIKLIDSNIFKKFFDKCISSGKSFLQETYENVTITIGYYKDILERAINDLFKNSITTLFKKVTAEVTDTVTIFRNSFGFLSQKLVANLTAFVNKLVYLESFDDGNMLFSLSYDYSILNNYSHGLEVVFSGLITVIAYILNLANTVVKGKVLI